MRICIVGHGPSMVGRNLGTYIDNHDLVVRLKASTNVLGASDYGKRCDVLCMSTEVVGLGYFLKPEIYWLYPKKGHYDKSIIGTFVGDVGRPVLVPLELMNDWNRTFTELMGGTHPNVSTGMAAVIIAGSFLRPSQITLPGFDTLLDPSVEFSRNNAIPRTGHGVIDHDWATENKFLKVVADTYKFQIATL